MASGGEMPSEDNRRWLECQICLSSMMGRKPRGLNCLHTFCESCLESLPLEAASITCPTCRRQTKLSSDGISGLPINFMIEQLATKLHQLNLCQTCVENEGASVQAVFYCNGGCGRICSDCRKRHDSVEHFKERQVEPLKKEDVIGTEHCVTHNKLIHSFCTKCKTYLCSTCALSPKHQGHESCIKEIQNEYQRIGSHIKGKTKAIQNVCTEKMLLIQEQEEKVEKINQEIEKEYKMRRQKLEKERTKLLEKMKQVSAPLRDSRSQVERIREGSKLIEESIETEGLEKYAGRKLSQIILDAEVCVDFQKEANGLKTPQVSEHRFLVSSCNTELGRLVDQVLRVGTKVRLRRTVLRAKGDLLYQGHVGHISGLMGYGCRVIFHGVGTWRGLKDDLEVVPD